MDHIFQRLGVGRRPHAGNRNGLFVALAIIIVAAGALLGNLIRLDGKAPLLGGYLYMANIRCPQERHGVIDMVLQTTLGITGPLYFAAGNDAAVTKAQQKVGPGCRLASVVQRAPLYLIVYPR